MPPILFVSLILVAVAVIFLAVALRNFLEAEGKLTPARRAWLRIALAFAAVGLGLQVLERFFR